MPHPLKRLYKTDFFHQFVLSTEVLPYTALPVIVLLQKKWISTENTLTSIRIIEKIGYR